MEIKKTVGQIATEVQQNLEPHLRPALEVAAENNEDYMNNVLEAVNRGCKMFNHDFYVEVILRNDPILHNVFRNQFFVRNACPTPTFDHSVFKYSIADGKIDYLWTIPCEDACIYLRNNAWFVEPDERWSLSFVLQYYNGTLMRKCKELNGEKLDSIALESGSKLDGAQTVILTGKYENN